MEGEGEQEETRYRAHTKLTIVLSDGLVGVNFFMQLGANRVTFIRDKMSDLCTKRGQQPGNNQNTPTRQIAAMGFNIHIHSQTWRSLRLRTNSPRLYVSSVSSGRS